MQKGGFSMWWLTRVERGGEDREGFGGGGGGGGGGQW